jgi:WD repeat/SOCS box-containing protein 1
MNLAFVGRPFPPDIDRQSLDIASLIEQLNPTVRTHHRAGCESWSCAWSGDGAYFAWSCGNGIVKLMPWNRRQHRMLSDENANDDLERELDEMSDVSLDAGELVWAVAFGSDVPHTKPHSTGLNWTSQRVARHLLATGLHSGSIKIWDVKSGKLLRKIIGQHTDVIRDLSFAPDGSLRLVSASRDGSLCVWGIRWTNGYDDGIHCWLIEKLPGGGRLKWMYGCCWSPNANMLASVGDSQSILLWNMVTYEQIRSLEGHRHDVCSCDFSPDGALLATSSYDTTVIVWDPHIGCKLMQLSHLFPSPPPSYVAGANDAYVRGVSFSHDGRHIATVSDDGFLRFWDIYCPDVPRQVGDVSNALCCRYSPDGAVVAVGTRNGSVTLWLALMQASSLQHLCRLAIRRLLPTNRIDELNVPKRLKGFLSYQVRAGNA